jgi:uncharacterized protein
MRLFALLLACLLLAGFATGQEIQDLVKAGRLEEAFRLSEQRARAGDAEAEEALGWFYEQGKVVRADKAQAVLHYRKGAEAGRKHAQWRLGVLLDTGDGVAADHREAFAWLEKSAAQNYGPALASLGLMHATGRGTAQDFRKSRDYYLRGARAGEPHGYYGIGVLHILGQGVAADPIEAFAWFTIAHFQGDPQAKAAMDRTAANFSEADMKRAENRMNEISRELGLGSAEQ